MYGFSRSKLLFTGTEVTTGWVREVEEVRERDEGLGNRGVDGRNRWKLVLTF